MLTLVDGGDRSTASGELYMPASLHFISNEEMLFKTHVASVCLKCFGCFRGISQVFQMNVTKVDRNVAYVAMVVHVCCKDLFLMFYLCLNILLQVCLFGCCIRFHIYVASVLSRYCICLQWFSSVFHIFLQVFQSMFQVFQLSSTYVASVMSGCLKSRSGVAYVVMRVRSGGDTSDSRTRSGGLDGVRAVRASVGT
jgi:hypothetical protein